MQQHRMRRYWLASCISLLFFAAGCFQPAGGGLEATSVAQTMPTFTPIPTDTPVPTDTPEATPTEEPTQSTIVTLEGILPILTDTPDPLALLGGTEVAFVPEVAQETDPVIGTATALALTQQGQFQPAPTNTPVIDPLALTATGIVSQATQTAAAPATQTAAALLGITAGPTLAPTIEGATAAPTALPSGSCVHTVVAGQNLFRISLQYNTTVDALAAANGIVNPNMIIAGQQLTIPGCGTSSGTGTTTGSSQSSGTVHIVRQGETLFQISLQYGVLVADLAARNNISNINLILIGQEIVIP